MDLAVARAPADGDERLRAVRAWWRERHPGPSLARRLDLLYTVAISVAILGALAYGTASSALAQVVSPEWLAHFGAPLALAALLLTARWGAFQGPVVFSVPDVTHLLGAPLPRRGLAVGRLRAALGLGATVGAIVAALVIVGLAGQGRGIATTRAAGMVAGLAALAVLGVAAAWAVERSVRWDRRTARAIWPAAVVAVGLGSASSAGHAGREVALWSGPWGWAVQAGTRAGSASVVVALGLLATSTTAAVAAAVRTSGDCPAERHLRRAEARANTLASLMSFDARSARRALEAAGPGTSPRAGRRLRSLRRVAAAGGPRFGAAAPTVWRDAVAVGRAPGRAAEAMALAAAGAGLALTNAGRGIAVLAAMLLVYFGAARMLWPMRAELDVPARTRVLLRPRLGRVLGAHAVVPGTAITAATALAAAVCAVAGGLPPNGAAAAVVALAVAPVVTLCAAMAARRGGRLPQSVLAGATFADPSGGGFAILAWLAWWPSLGAGLGAAPILIAAKGTAGGAVVAAGVVVAVGALLAGALGRDPDEG